MSQDLAPYEPAAPFVPGPQPFSPRKYFAAVRRKWWLILLLTLLPAGGAFYYDLKKPVIYVSRAAAFVKGKMRLADVGQYTEDGQTFFATQIELMKSERIQVRAMERVKAPPLNMEAPKDKLGAPNLPRLRIVQAPKSSVIVLESVSENGPYAKAFLDALIDEFMAYRKQVRSETSGDALASVSTQLYKGEKDLKDEEEKLARFSQTNNLALLEENVRGGGGQLAQMNAQIAFLRLELKLLEATAVEKQGGVGDAGAAVTVHTNAAVATVAAAVPSLAGQQTDYVSAQQQLEMLKIQRQQLGRYLKPKHPKMARLSDEIARSERVIEFYKSRTAEQLRAAKEGNLIRLASLQEEAKILGEKVGEANRRMAEYQQIKAGIERLRVWYERLLALLQSVDLNSSMNQEDVSILERASEAKPPKPQTIVIVAGAAVLGLGLALGIVFLLVRLDDRCDSLVEIRAQFPEQIFGQLPEIQVTGPEGQLPMIKVDDDRHILVESCRSLRSSLLFGLANGERPKVIAITSSGPDEGKSTISSNLATTLAQGGSKVLLVDADIRRGHLHQQFGKTAEPGLTNGILQGKELSKLVIETDTHGLFFLPRGKCSSSGELFLSPRFDKLMEQARQEFDFVILDSIPVFAADDATTLAPKADGVLFVIRRGHTSARLAQEALDLLYQRKARVLGIVFNRADSEARSYNYYKYSKYYAAEV